MGPKYDDSEIKFTPPSFFEEECGEFVEKDYALFPLKQYKLRDPCKKCIVQPMCGARIGKICPDKFKHLDWTEYYQYKLKQFDAALEAPGNFCWESLKIIFGILFFFGSAFVAAWVIAHSLMWIVKEIMT